MRFMAMVLALGLGALAQEATGVGEAAAEPGGGRADTASLRQGEDAWKASLEPAYRTREPLRAAGTPKELVGGKGSGVGIDKTQKGSGDW